MRVCPSCLTELPLTAFSRHKQGPGGLRSWCRECVSISNKKWRDAKGNRHLALMGRHKMSIADYDELLAKQNHRCGACGSFNPKTRWGVFMVDHDHKCCDKQRSCGKCTRGLLCGPCNMALGQVNDSILHLRLLISYLEEFE